MKALHLIAVAALIASPAYAQQGSTGGHNAADASTQSQKTTAEKIKSDLQSAGFKNVNVIAQSFAVTAKSKDGNDVYMTFGPTGMSLVEAAGTVHSNSSSSGNTQSKN